VSTHRLADGERPTRYEGITFATVQTLSKQRELPHFDLVLVDEAHHLGAPDYIKTIERLQPKMLGGVTATPWRSDKVSISTWLGTPVFSMGIKEGLAEGFLAEVDYRVFADGINWKFISDQSQFGYSIAQLNKYLLIPTRDDEAIRRIQSVVTDENITRGIVFSPSQTHARSFASDLRRRGFKAASLTSEDDNIQRYRILSQFAAGHLNFICVVDIFNEGMDVPDVDLLVFMRVTHSRRIFVQQLGRGLRISATKRRVVVLDFAADVRRVHAAVDLSKPDDRSSVERLVLSSTHVDFSDKSMGKFFYEWISDLGNIQDFDEDEVVRLPIINPAEFNFPDPLEF
jgi:superfamily II DNA or RNA helicase